jgi:hypothetical protein
VTRIKQALGDLARRSRLGTIMPLGATVRSYGSTDKLAHGYVSGYAAHLRGRRWSANRILEIGVGGYESDAPGGSLRIWRDWFPRSTIVGLDIHDKNVDLGRRVRFVQGDQSRAEDLDRAVAALGGPPTIIIDDGSHRAGDAITSFLHLFPLMPAGSVYVIEDLHTSYWEDYGGGVPAPASTATGMILSLVESVQADDRIFGWRPDLPRPAVQPHGIASMDVRPGVVFITKA